MWKWETDEQPKAVVVIIHSAFEYHHWYAWLIEKLRTAGYHVVMGDLPGHSEGSKFTRVHDETIEDYLRYIKTLMENALTYHLPVFIIGHGLGGTLAIRFLMKSKLECAGLILTSPWLQLKKQPNLLKSALTNVGGSIISNKKITLDFDKQMLTRNVDGYQEIDDEVSYQTNVTSRWYRDIQQEAIDATKKRLEENNVASRASVILDGHENISSYVQGEVAGAIFNLGYLPGADHDVITKGNTTIQAIEQLLHLLKVGGIIVLVVYHGHEGGKEECDEVLDYVSSLPQKNVHVLRYEFINQQNDPPFINSKTR